MNHSEPAFMTSKGTRLTGKVLPDKPAVKFAYVGGIMAQRGFSVREMARIIREKYTPFRRWLQIDMKDIERAKLIQMKMSKALGIIIVESPYDDFEPDPGQVEAFEEVTYLRARPG